MSSATTTPQPGAAAAEAGEADVEFRAVTKRFGSLVAVNAVSLRVHKGEFLSLLGPSGCGKTTSLRMIAGFEQPDAGEILIGGRDVAGTPPYKRDVNTVFQQYALFPHMSILENVSYGLTVCAERCDAFAAVASGETKDWDAIAIVIDDDKLPSPCGACRQVLAEFAPDLKVVLATTSGLRKTTTMTALLPEPFLPGNLA